MAIQRVKTKTIEKRLQRLKRPEDFRLALRMYVRMYESRFRRKPLPSYHINQLDRFGASSTELKYARIFHDIVAFLALERQEAKGANSMESLLKDYYSAVLSYYARFNRLPTMQQISPGITNTNLFITFVIQEESDWGSYWMTEEEVKKVNELVTYGGNIFRDEILEEFGILPPIHNRQNRVQI